MEIKILQVFYGKDGLPYKDKDRQVHFPIAGTGFLGASNTTKIKFYYDELDNLDETTWVAVSKLPNGKVGSRVLESHLDEELNEHYALLELDNYYTQYKGDVFISLQGYQGGVDFDYDEENSQYEIHGTPTIAATGSIKFTINYANQFVGSGQTDNINFQRILAALGTKLGMRAYSEHVEELPSEGSPDVFYVINDDPNDPTLQNIYVWNENTRHYIWVGDNRLDLGDYYTREEGEAFEEEINETVGALNGRVTNVEYELSNVAQGSPKGVYSTLSALQTAYPTGASGIYVVSADGHWYYWNGSAWTDGGVYQATQLADNVALKYYNVILGTGDDLNDYKNSIFARILNPTHSPTSSNALLEVFRTTEMVFQHVINPETNMQWTRRYYIPTDTWTSWSSITVADNSITRNKIADNNVVKTIYLYGVTDFNTILNSEVHISTGGTNSPINEGGVLRTYSSETNKYQLFSTESGKSFIRKYNYGTSSWGNWIRYDADKYYREIKAVDDYNISGDINNKIEANGFLYTDGSFIWEQNYHSLAYIKISCNPGDTFIYKGKGPSAGASAIFYQQNGTTIIRYDTYDSLNEFTKVTIPENCYFVTFASYAPTGETITFELYKTNKLTERIETFCASPLWQKRWSACGDSFTQGQFNGLDDPSDYTFTGNEKYKGKYKVYPYFIGNRTNCIVNNMAVSGMTLAQNSSSTSSTCFSYPSGKYTQIPSNADIITLYFGINDSHANIPIGTIDDATNDTFYGAWNVVISWILENRPNAKVGIIISNGCDTTAYPEATIAIAKKWGIAYLDINGDDKLPMVIRANKRNLSSAVYNYWYDKYKVSADNGHPNPKAHEDESYMIQQFLERL